MISNISKRESRGTAHAAKSLRWSVENLMKYLIRATNISTYSKMSRSALVDEYDTIYQYAFIQRLYIFNANVECCAVSGFAVVSK